MTSLRVYQDSAALARAAAEEVAALARNAVAVRGRCHVALSGGSTPKAMFGVLAALGRGALPWDQIDLWWGDERCVPPDHPDSNFGVARRELIEPLALDSAHVHRMTGELDPTVAARDYERLLVATLGPSPILDLALLGMGPDGHTASLFPGSAALAETAHDVVANAVTSPLVKGTTMRITFTPPLLRRARHVRFIVGGADKAATLAAVLDGPAGHYPAQLVTGDDVSWMVDAAANGGR